MFKTSITPLDAQMLIASRNLSRYMIEKATSIHRQYGMGYVESDKAPNSFAELQTAYWTARRDGRALPVYAGASDGTIYTSKEANWSFRFWHDTIHVVYDLKFTLADEVRVAEIQALAVGLEFGTSSLEYRMFMADTAGQSVYAAMNGGNFPADQWAFVRTLVGQTGGVPLYTELPQEVAA